MTFSSLWSYVWVLNYLAVILAIENILRNRREPRGMLAWILALILLPFVGLFLYMLIGPVPIQRKMRRRILRRKIIAPSLAEQKAILSKSHDARVLAKFDDSTRGLMRLATALSDAIVTSGNSMLVHHDAERAFLNHSLGIESAEHHIHMEYYIFAADETGTAMRDLLVKKAKQGVEVRLLLDAVGCWKLSRRFVREMQGHGIEVAFFLPWGLTNRRLQLNCRNHRKLTVIDGKRGFTGSKNIADEYLGRVKKFGKWRDTYVEMQGPCVTQLQVVFAEDWHFATKTKLISPKYFPPPEVSGDKVVQVVQSGPDGRGDVMHQLLNSAVSDAAKSISIVTPYFVPDRAMMLALTSAAYQGVHVRLLLPSKSDSFLVLWAGRTFYADLIDAGVEIYEYDDCMIHSKVVIVDQRWSMVGSANMDVRSFQLNFELTNIIYDEDVSRELQVDFDGLCLKARRIDNQALTSWTYPETLAMGFARLATPIL
jgi:cardiolipin synthase A/B